MIKEVERLDPSGNQVIPAVKGKNRLIAGMIESASSMVSIIGFFLLVMTEEVTEQTDGLLIRRIGLLIYISGFAVLACASMVRREESKSKYRLLLVFVVASVALWAKVAGVILYCLGFINLALMIPGAGKRV